MAQTLTVAGKYSIPLEDGGTAAQVDLGVTFPLTARADFSRSYDAPISADTVNLGTLATAGAKGVLVKCTLGSCTITFNSGSVAWPLSTGSGYFLWINGSQGFLTSAAITTAAAATIVFIAVG